MGQLILVIDDSEFNLKVVKDMLKESFQVECVNSGEAAFEYLRRQIPDLILLDLHMPVMNGFEVIRRLKADSVWKEIPVVMLTADGDRDNEVRCFELGAMDFITKPIISQVMLQRVSRILKLTRLQKFLQFEVEEQTRRAEDRRRQVEQLSEEIMKTLASTIDAKDRYTNGHSLRVAMYSKEIARRCGMSKREQKEIYHMGLLHDIGKIGVPDTIINKRDKLSEEEYEAIRQHPKIGSDILKTIQQIPDIMVGARWHHERFDGTGYPDGLKGLDIPEYARIIGVADAYDAMTSKRSYRDILPQEVVRSELENGKGSQFDPVFAEVMIQMIDDDIRYTMREKDFLPKGI
ncbi:MAG: response regulator [Lachnospiraceae bacterium]|nr:response regulator [Lachnospiraceae bacterium]